MNRRPLQFAPKEIFEQILEYAVIPTFDLVVWFEGRGVALVRRRIAPYRGFWALPGLRMMKPEGIEDTLRRIARSELGVEINPSDRLFLGQYVGRFRTEKGRQDLSTGYAVPCVASAITINPAHFSGFRFIASEAEIPNRTGAMYRFYLKRFFVLRDSFAGSSPNSN
ncbi:MAG: NUDIX domain-containing protein [Deltaproteobacteria bacterium]|nr:NUDIX domain-containing protein [Deltaproteobacteria bacterium]